MSTPENHIHNSNTHETSDSASAHDVEGDPVAYLHEKESSDNNTHNNDEEEGVEPYAPVERQQSRLQRVQTQLSFFNQKLKDKRLGILKQFALNYVVMGVLLLGIFSIYWGSMYGRFDRLKNLDMLVVIDDDSAPEGLETFGDGIIRLLNTDAAKYYGNWQIHNYTTYNAKATKHNRTIEEQIQVDIHHQKYWSSIYVRQNATANWLAAMKAGNGSYTTTNNTISSIYETGRDFLTMNAYVTSGVEDVSLMWLDMVNEIADPIVSSLSTEEKATLFNSTDTLSLLNTPIGFQFIDRIPWTDPVLVAPSQVGLIYMIILSFFNVGFFQDVHQRVATFGLKPHHYLLYRYLSSAVSYFWLSLMYCFVTLAMQVDFTVTFGKSGFLVYWMTSYMTMWIVGSVNEIMACWLVLLYPPLMGFWLIFWVIINISPTFTPVELSPRVYRYGYGLPIYNSYEITKVILFDTYKGFLGRNYGILVAWCVLTSVLLIGTLIAFKKIMVSRKQKEVAAAAAAAEAAESKQ